MTKERFDEILIKEGIDNQVVIDVLWEVMDQDSEDEAMLRRIIQWLKEQPQYKEKIFFRKNVFITRVFPYLFKENLSPKFKKYIPIFNIGIFIIYFQFFDTRRPK